MSLSVLPARESRVLPPYARVADGHATPRHVGARVLPRSNPRRVAGVAAERAQRAGAVGAEGEVSLAVELIRCVR